MGPGGKGQTPFLGVAAPILMNNCHHGKRKEVFCNNSIVPIQVSMLSL